MDYALEIEGLRKNYSDFTLQDVSLKVPKGSIMGFIGENGAGKSTTFKAVLDLICKDGGTITFWGQELTDQTPNLKEDIGVVFDGINFYETLTPTKVGSICKAAYKNWDAPVYHDYLKKFGLNDKKEIKTFSKGMQVKLCLAVALSHHAKLLLLDEPTSGLDPIMRDDILDIFLDFVQDEEHSILISSHITSDLEKIADYITFIHNGKILLSEVKDEMIYNYGIMKCKASEFEKIDKADIMAYRKMDYQWEVLVKDKTSAARKYKDVIIDTATLDEIMLLYVKGEQLS